VVFFVQGALLYWLGLKTLNNFFLGNFFYMYMLFKDTSYHLFTRREFKEEDKEDNKG